MLFVEGHENFQIDQKCVSENSNFLKMCLLGIEITLKNSNCDLGNFGQLGAFLIIFQQNRGFQEPDLHPILKMSGPLKSNPLGKKN